MSGPTIDTYECVHCKKEVPWYEPGDPETKRADYEMKTCATCRQIAKNKAAALARRVAKLPRPSAPCACGCAEFLCSPFNEHTGEYRGVEGLMFSSMATRSGGALYLLACRACGRAEIYVEGIRTLEPDPNLDSPWRRRPRIGERRVPHRR